MKKYDVCRAVLPVKYIAILMCVCVCVAGLMCVLSFDMVFDVRVCLARKHQT